MNENMQQYDVSVFEDAGIHWYTLSGICFLPPKVGMPVCP